MLEDGTEIPGLTRDEIAFYLRTSAQMCSTAAGNAFFNSFRYVQLLHEGHYSECLIEGLKLLGACKEIDEHSFNRIHKGSAYYWIAMAAFLANDFQSATFFFDAAVTEDLRAGYHPVTRSTPSFKFLMAEGEPDTQAAKTLTAELQRRLQFAIDDYNQRLGRTNAHPTLSIDLLRSHFLAPALSNQNRSLRSLPTALASFVLEWFYLNLFLHLRGGPGTTEPFLVHMFKGCLLFETLLRENPLRPVPASATSLLPALQHVHRELGLPNNMPISAPDFSAVLSYARSSPNTIKDAFIIAGRARNTLGHRLSWSSDLDNQTFNKLVIAILVSCFHTILNLHSL